MATNSTSRRWAPSALDKQPLFPSPRPSGLLCGLWQGGVGPRILADAADHLPLIKPQVQLGDRNGVLLSNQGTPVTTSRSCLKPFPVNPASLAPAGRRKVNAQTCLLMKPDVAYVPSLVLDELATTARKHGALRHPKVSVIARRVVEAHSHATGPPMCSSHVLV